MARNESVLVRKADSTHDVTNDAARVELRSACHARQVSHGHDVFTA